MQVRKLAALVAIACASLSGSAFAASLSPEQQAVLNDANSNSRILFISGASAVQKGFTGIISSLIPGAKTYFADKNGKDANGKAVSHGYEAVAGQLDNTIGGDWAGKNAIIIYRVSGGSVYGINPVARNAAIESLNVSALTCNDGGYAAANGSAANDKAFVCAKTDRIPDAGVSDVAPAMFKTPFNTEGEVPQDALSASELAEFGNSDYNQAIYSLAFGVPVTSNIDPMLNRAKVAAIMSSAVGTWDMVNADLPADDIVICRRAPGSGTQAVFNSYFGNFPCGTNSIPADRAVSSAFDPNAAWTWTDPADGKTYSGVGKYTIDSSNPQGWTVVIENAASGDVRTCLNKAVTGGSYVTKNRDGGKALHLVEFVNPDNKAIGILSMDSLKDSKTTGNWQFRSLDGKGTYTWDNTSTAPVATGDGKFPTLANLMNGNWDVQGWISFNTPIRTQQDANKAPVIARFLSTAKNPQTVTSNSDLKNVAAAIPGGEYTEGQVLSVGYDNGNQCAPLISR